MKIQYASDLHLEFLENTTFLKNNPLRVTGDILILAGDIAYWKENGYEEHPFWDWVSQNYKQVIVIPGNHEFYMYYDVATIGNGVEIPIRENVIFTYNKVIHIEDVDIIASTLWAHIDLKLAFYTERCVSDFHRILYSQKLLTHQDFNQLHKECLEFIKTSVENSTAKTKIVVTHHVPSQVLMSKEFSGSLINGAFVVELGEYIENSGIDFWIYGHSHRNIDCQIGKTLCLSNQLGYIKGNEHNSFDNGKYIEV